MSEPRIIKAGTVVQVAGYPIKLLADVQAEFAGWGTIDMMADEEARAKAKDSYFAQLRADHDVWLNSAAKQTEPMGAFQSVYDETATAGPNRF